MQDDDSYDEDDHNEVIQYLLDVVDEEAQNLLNLSNATSGNHLPGTVKESCKEQVETLQDFCKIIFYEGCRAFLIRLSSCETQSSLVLIWPSLMASKAFRHRDHWQERAALLKETGSLGLQAHFNILTGILRSFCPKGMSTCPQFCSIIMLTLQ